MHFENAIDKLNKEIILKENTIKSINNFYDLNFKDQLETIKGSNLRYNKEFKEEWVNKILNYKDFEIQDNDPNGIKLLYKNHWLYIPTHDYNQIIIDEVIRIKTPLPPCDRDLKLMKKMLEITDKYLKVPSINNFKEVLKLNTSKYKNVLWWFDRVKSFEIVLDENEKSKTYISTYDEAWYKYKCTLIDNDKVRKFREDFEYNIKEDLKMFEENGFKIMKRY